LPGKGETAEINMDLAFDFRVVKKGERGRKEIFD
jgi:hypothetical protein